MAAGRKACGLFFRNDTANERWREGSTLIFPEERLERRERTALQLRRLTEAVTAARERIPLIDERFEARHIAKGPVRSLEEVQTWPFMFKSDLRDHYPFGLFGVARKDVRRIQGSSGTKGKPTLVGYSEADVAMWSEVVARCLSLVGAESGQMLHNAYGYGLFTGGLGLHGGAEFLGLTVLPSSSGNTARQILLLKDLRPEGISCTPSYALNLAEALRAEGTDPASIGLKWGILGAEPWSEAIRTAIEDAFHMDACDIYGLSEVIGPGVAAECHEAKDGLHIHEDHFLAEVVDPETGELKEDGEEGELVFTTLTREVSPVIRFRTGDIASLTHEPCRCGRTTARMSRLKGRVDDMFVLRGVNIFPQEVERLILEEASLAPHYLLRLSRRGALDDLTVQVEPREPLSSTGSLSHQLEGRLRNTFGVRIGVEVVAPGTLPRSEGKAKRLIDERKGV